MSATPLGWLAGFAGGYLLYSALWDRHPLEDLRGTLTGAGTAPSKPLGSGSGGGATAGAGGTSPAAPSTSSDVSAALGAPVPKSACVPIDTKLSAKTATKPQIGYTIYLTPDATRAFHAWEASYGGKIPCTGGWRSVEEANTNHARDPQRYADGNGSAHTRGRAVDVDGNWLGSLSAAQQSKLRTAAKANGWVQARWKGEANCGTNTSNDNEPLHFAWKVCA